MSNILCEKLKTNAFHQMVTIHHCFPSHNHTHVIYPRKHLSNFLAHGSFWKWVINIVIVFVCERHRRLVVNGPAWPLTLCVCVCVCVCVCCYYNTRPSIYTLKWSLLSGTDFDTNTHEGSKVHLFPSNIRFNSLPGTGVILFFSNFKGSSVCF